MRVISVFPFCSLQLENLDVVVADHMQRVMKPNFAVSWEEIGEENQVEETFALSTMKDMEGWFVWSVTCLICTLSSNEPVLDVILWCA